MSGASAGAVGLTSEQAAAVSAREGLSVALRSSAGCGKTEVLTRRYLSMVARQPEPDLSRIVVVTFTERAATELRQRIRASCRRRLGNAGAEESRRWRSALRQLEGAPISTFHAFCGDLLRSDAIAAGVDPEFSVIDEMLSSTVRSEALRRCLRGLLADRSDDLCQLAVEFGLQAVQETLEGLMSSRAVEDLDLWADSTVDRVIERWKAEWAAECVPRVASTLYQSLRRSVELHVAGECTGAFGRQRLEAFVDLADLIKRFERDPARLGTVVKEVGERARMKGGGEGKDWQGVDYQALMASVKEVRETAKKSERRLQIDEEATRAAAIQSIRLARLGREALATYARVKREDDLLDFDDLLQLTRGWLSDAARRPAAGESDEATELDVLRSRFDGFLIDEFQDTDPVQGEILRWLSGPWPAAGKLFLVGDSKQSIYRFRGADPRVFDEFATEFEDAGRLRLTENFRSMPEVLEFVNAVFAGEPGFAPEEALRAGRQPPEGLFYDSPAVEFLWPADSPADSGIEAEDAAARRASEATRIAARVVSWLNEGWTVRDRARGGIRPAQPGDVALLFRTLRDSGHYERALSAAGLDFYVRGASAFFAQQEVLDVINVLTAIEDPFDALALAGALRSPLLGLSDNALYWLTVDAPGVPGDLCENFAAERNLDRMRPQDRSAVIAARERMVSWRRAKDQDSIASLLARVLDETGYEVALVAEPLGERKRANVRKLVRQARRYDQAGFALADFAARLRSDLARPPREDQAATTVEGHSDAVQLMTVHAAKGLQFPLVVLPDLDRRGDERRRALGFSRRLGPLVQLPDEGRGLAGDDPGRGLAAQVARDLELAESEAEARRLFYVALTRAEQHLVLSATKRPVAGAATSSVAMSVLMRHFDPEDGSYLMPELLPDSVKTPMVRVRTEEAEIVADRPESLSQTHFDMSAILDSTPLEGRGQSEPRQWIPTPTCLDVDGLRRDGLAPSRLRLAELVCAVWVEWKGAGHEPMADCVARAANGMVPAAGEGLRTAAVEALNELMASPQTGSLANKPRIIAMPWNLRWEPRGSATSGGSAIVLTGTLDLAVHHDDGDWTGLGVVVDGEDEALARVRLAGALLAGVLPGRIRRAGLIRLGGPIRFDEEQIDPDIQRAVIAEWIRGRFSDGFPGRRS